MNPNLSIIVLTLDEERYIGDCLRSLAQQQVQEHEVIVVDAGSTDATVDIVQREQEDFPVPLHLVQGSGPLPVSEARNRGVRLAQADRIAFLSADAQAHRGWVEHALGSLDDSDIAYSRQVHDPYRWTVAAAVRGLRYHFPDGPAQDPVLYASNVAAAYRREVLQDLSFEEGVDAVDDLLLARRALHEGYRITYDPQMVVRHHDVEETGQEFSKNQREALEWGLNAQELGPHLHLLAWASALGLMLLLVAWRPAWGLGLLALTLYAPALRRAVRRRDDMPLPALIKGTLSSPPFDLAYLVNYLRGLAAGRERRAEDTETDTKEASP